MAQNLKNLRTKRSVQPAHYLLKLNAYSSICSTIDEYESEVFEAGGYKWRLLLHPKGDYERDEENHISLYLKIAETHTLPAGWEVNAIFTLFVYNQLEDKYIAVQDLTGGGVKRFHAMKTAWGFTQLFPLETFKDPSKGYLVNDCCVFGAEVFVVKHTGNRETLSLIESDPCICNATFIKKYEKFSKYKAMNDSEDYTYGGKKWCIRIYPNGKNECKGESLGLFLLPSAHWNDNSSTYVKASLRLRDQVNDNHVECEVDNWFRPSCGWGSEHIISLKELHNPSRGLIVNDCLIVEVKFFVISEITRRTGQSK